jgi:hypothetical protein
MVDGVDGSGRSGRLTLWAGAGGCVVVLRTTERGMVNESTSTFACAESEQETLSLSLNMFPQDRVAVPSVNGEPLDWLRVPWPSQAGIVPGARVDWENHDAPVDLISIIANSAREEYFSYSFDEGFEQLATESARWQFLAPDRATVRSDTSLGGPRRFTINALPTNQATGFAAAGILRSRPFPLANVEVGARLELRSLAMGAAYVRFAAESYWQRRLFEAGVLDVGGQAVGYCAGHWGGEVHVEHAAHVFASTLPRSKPIDIRITHRARDGVAEAFIDGQLLCSHKTMIPPYADANLELGANLHDKTGSAVDVTFNRAWFHK